MQSMHTGRRTKVCQQKRKARCRWELQEVGEGVRGLSQKGSSLTRECSCRSITCAELDLLNSVWNM